MQASAEWGGRSLSQYSQFGRSCNAMIVASSFQEAIVAGQKKYTNDEFPSISDT
jgi:hypothetical protein